MNIVAQRGFRDQIGGTRSGPEGLDPSFLRRLQNPAWQPIGRSRKKIECTYDDLIATPDKRQLQRRGNCMICGKYSDSLTRDSRRCPDCRHNVAVESARKAGLASRKPSPR